MTSPNESLLPREKVAAAANLRSKVAIERSEIYGLRGCFPYDITPHHPPRRELSRCGSVTSRL